MKTEFSFVAQLPTERLDVFLVRKTQQSRVFIKSQIERGHVLVNGKLAIKASLKLKAGDQVSGSLIEEELLGLVPIEGRLDIVFEDADLLVINKHQGIVVHPASAHRGETLVHHLLYHLRHTDTFRTISPTRPGIVHRLDRGTSGLLLVAKTRVVQERLAKQFKSRLIKKEYEAVVWGVTRSEGVFNSPIGRHFKDRKRMSSKTYTGRDALTRWRATEKFAHFTHVALFPHTGRTHQLRVHLSEGGHPIVGDALYGGGTTQRRAGLSELLQDSLEAALYPFLHARALAFTHPTTGAEMALTAPRPPSFDKLLSLLRSFDR